MPIYEYRCDCGGTAEVLAAPVAPAPACPACGADTRKAVSAFAVGGRAEAGLSQSQMPQTWKGTYGGNPEYITMLQRHWERRRASRGPLPRAGRRWPPDRGPRGSSLGRPVARRRPRGARRWPVARGPGPTLQAKESSAGVTTMHILTGTSTLTQRGLPPTAAYGCEANERPTGGADIAT